MNYSYAICAICQSEMRLVTSLNGAYYICDCGHMRII